MQFDWTTFALELLNFLVLVWLLKHFFYKPVLTVLDARKQAVADQAVQAAAIRTEAEALKAQYEARLQQWRAEQDQARHGLEQELAQERARQLDALKKTLTAERTKEEAQESARETLREARLVRQASATAYAQAAAMLTRLAGPELSERIAEVVAEDLIALPEERRAALQQAAAALGPAATAEIESAHALPDAALRILTGALEETAGQSLELKLTENAQLIGGVRIAVGECLLQANLADELAFFRSGSASREGVHNA